jgi:hypothetical protein
MEGYGDSSGGVRLDRLETLSSYAMAVQYFYKD